MHGIPGADVEPQKLIVQMVGWLERWLLQMEWAIVKNESDFPFPTSGEPVNMCKYGVAGIESGVGFGDAKLQIGCPITPKLGFMARHSAVSLAAVRTDNPDEYPAIPPKPHSIAFGALDPQKVRRFNLGSIANAGRYAYSSYKDQKLQKFFFNRFVGMPGPVRREDRKPIGSPVIQM
jgi:hypothetical protein